MGRIEDVIDVLALAVTAAINNAGITAPSQGYLGWPTSPELTEILSQNEYAYSFFPLTGGRRLPPRGKDRKQIVMPTPTVNASVAVGANFQLILSGTPGIYNFSILYGHPTLGIQYLYYKSQSIDTLNSIASEIAILLNAVGGPISATVSGSSVTITGALSVKCNIGTTGTITQFQSRFEQRIQVSVWTPNAYQNTGSPSVDKQKGLRSAVVDAIINNVGTDMNMWYSLPDGSDVRLRLSAMPLYRDDSQSDYNVYEAHLIFLAEYVLQSSTAATQVGVFEESTSIGGLTPIVTFGG